MMRRHELNHTCSCHCAAATATWVGEPNNFSMSAQCLQGSPSAAAGREQSKRKAALGMAKRLRTSDTFSAKTQAMMSCVTSHGHSSGDGMSLFKPSGRAAPTALLWRPPSPVATRCPAPDTHRPALELWRT